MFEPDEVAELLATFPIQKAGSSTETTNLQVSQGHLINIKVAKDQFEDLNQTSTSRITLEHLSQAFLIPTSQLIQILQQDFPDTVFDVSRSRVVPLKEQNAISKQLEDAVNGAFVDASSFARDKDISVDALKELVQKSNLNVSYKSEHAVFYRDSDLKALEDFVSSEIKRAWNDFKACKLSRHTWTVERVPRGLMHELVSEFCRNEDLPGEHIGEGENEQYVPATMRSAELAAGTLEIYDLRALYPKTTMYESPGVMLFDEPNIVAISEWFAVNKGWWANVTDQLKQKALSEAARDVQTSREAIRSLSLPQLFLQLPNVPLEVRKDPSFLAGLSGDKAGKEATAVYEEHVKQLNTSIRKDLDILWTSKVLVPFNLASSAINEVAAGEADLSKQLTKLYASFLASKIVPKEIERAKDRELLRGTTADSARDELLASMTRITQDQELTDFKRVKKSLDTFANRLGLSKEATLESLKEGKDKQVEQQLASLIKDTGATESKEQQDKAPRAFLTLVVLLWAKQTSGVLYATSKQVPRLTKLLESRLDANMYARLTELKNAVVSRKVSTEAMAEMRAMIKGEQR